MPTRRGWGLALAAIGVVVCGRLLGAVELYVVAVAGVVLLVAALAYVRFTRFSLETSRTLRPGRVHAGGSSRVDLTVRNTTGRRSPVMDVRDPFDDGRRTARFQLAPLAPEETARAAYRLPTDQRGVFNLGPLEVGLTDPFRLAAVSLEAAPSTELTVYPRIDLIEPLPPTPGQQDAGGSQRSRSFRSGGDFAALRPYQIGDDLRKVHWPSTARLDELMVRQEEQSSEDRSTVFVDLRRGAHTAASFELALSVGASIVHAAWRRGSQLRLVTTGGFDSGLGQGRAHAEAMLEELATAATGGEDDMPLAIASLRRSAGGALAAVVTGVVPTANLEALSTLRATYGRLVLVLLERSSFETSAAARRVPPRPVPSAATVVRVTDQVPFAEAWAQAIGPVRVTGGATAGGATAGGAAAGGATGGAPGQVPGA